MSIVSPLIIYGTRPEVIKVAPIIKECRTDQAIKPIVCSTGQHNELIREVTEYFDIQTDYNLQLMKKGQTLTELTARCLSGLERVVDSCRPDCIVAQGDTTTVLAASMVGFLKKIPFVHVEAGLRTGRLDQPWPEEFNRRVASIGATLHCAPTEKARENLVSEGIHPETISVTGNSVIDSLFWTIDKERERTNHWIGRYPYLENKKMVLVTGHRRENFGDGFKNVCEAIKQLASGNKDIEFVYPVHLNPQARAPVFEILSNSKNIHLIDPLSYPEFVWLMDRAVLIITDSGGVQEEAPSLGKPVLVTRDCTERPEAIETGLVQLVGNNKSKIVEAASMLIRTFEKDKQRADRLNSATPYGDGTAGKKITTLIGTSFGLVDEAHQKVA
jgi:UDP-N-acetylglucosamine 2-epimerase (non-hydrolysing)